MMLYSVSCGEVRGRRDRAWVHYTLMGLDLRVSTWLGVVELDSS